MTISDGRSAKKGVFMRKKHEFAQNCMTKNDAISEGNLLKIFENQHKNLDLDAKKFRQKPKTHQTWRRNRSETEKRCYGVKNSEK